MHFDIWHAYYGLPLSPSSCAHVRTHAYTNTLNVNNITFIIEYTKLEW